MKIDWFTIIAQVINLLVLLWLMKRFLYKPIIHAIDEREKRIAGELADAETTKETAQKLKEEYDRKNEDLKGQSASFLKSARDEAQTEKLRLLQETREAAVMLSEERKELLIEEEKTLRTTVSRRTHDQVLAVSRKVLADLAGTNVDEQIVAVFIQKLHDLNVEEIKVLSTALKTGSGSVTIQTAFDILKELRTRIETSIKELLGSDACIAFKTAPELISGIELAVNGQKVCWSVSDYLSTIEEGIKDGNT